MSRDDWDAHWRHYAASARENPAQHLRHRWIASQLRDAEAGARILDLGSGQGDLLELLAALQPENWRLAGFEMSAEGVAEARRKVPGASWVVGDVFDPPGEMAAYQQWATHAVCSEVLEHVDEPSEFLRRAGRYLAPGALLLVTVPGGPMSAFDRHIGHRMHFTRDSLSEVVRKAGLVPQRVYRLGFPFFNLYRGVVILRGSRLIHDVEGEAGAASPLARAVMGVFDKLFYCSLDDFSLGWQMAAVCRKP